MFRAVCGVAMLVLIPSTNTNILVKMTCKSFTDCGGSLDTNHLRALGWTVVVEGHTHSHVRVGVWMGVFVHLTLVAGGALAGHARHPHHLHATRHHQRPRHHTHLLEKQEIFRLFTFIWLHTVKMCSTTGLTTLTTHLRRNQRRLILRAEHQPSTILVTRVVWLKSR